MPTLLADGDHRIAVLGPIEAAGESEHAAVVTDDVARRGARSEQTMTDLGVASDAGVH